MSCIFPSHSESQIAIGAWKKSSYLSLFSPFHTNSRLLLPHRPLDTSPRPPVQSSGFFLTCQAWLIRFPTSCHRRAEAPRARGLGPSWVPVASCAAVSPVHLRHVSAEVQLGAGGSHHALSCGCWDSWGGCIFPTPSPTYTPCSTDVVMKNPHIFFLFKTFLVRASHFLFLTEDIKTSASSKYFLNLLLFACLLKIHKPS